jgi:geranylgeranyl diphosphate synthase type II
MSYIQDFKKYSLMAEKWIEQKVCPQDLPEGYFMKPWAIASWPERKRLRPVLALAVCDILKGSRDIVLPFACAIELIHTYSLIHDDLRPWTMMISEGESPPITRFSAKPWLFWQGMHF